MHPIKDKMCLCYYGPTLVCIVWLKGGQLSTFGWYSFLTWLEGAGWMIIPTMLGHIRRDGAFSSNFLAAGSADRISIVVHNTLIIFLEIRNDRTLCIAFLWWMWLWNISSLCHNVPKLRPFQWSPQDLSMKIYEQNQWGKENYFLILFALCPELHIWCSSI